MQAQTAVPNTVTILVFVGSYLPGYKGGGPIRSIANIVELLGDEFEFKIITADHDFGENVSYPGITQNSWYKVGKAHVYYASKENLQFYAMRKLINSVSYDILYLNSFFCLDFSIKPLLLRFLKLTPNVPTILAPRGEFSLGALQLKSLKKWTYILLTQFVGLYNNMIWQASSHFEKEDILRVFAGGTIKIGAPIIIAPDLVHSESNISKFIPRVKKTGVLEIAFISRISPKKNLEGALSMLNGIQGNLVFNIFGPSEDQDYWHRCQAVSKTLNGNIKVNFCGEIEHSRVQEIFSAHHLFFFPTFGENFGHVILESFLAGCPVLLSDQTPWRGLDILGVGWDVPLDKPDKFIDVLNSFVAMDQDEFTNVSLQTLEYGHSIMNDPTTLKLNRELFKYPFNNDQ